MAIASVGAILLPALAAVVLYGAFKLVHHRLQWRNVPQPPGNFLMGHLKLMGETMALFPPKVHPMYVFTEWHRRYNLPDVFYVDLWPLGPVFMVLATKEAAAHAVQTRGYGKDVKLIGDALTPIMGADPIVATNGAPWKAAHRMIAPAFKPSAVRGMLGHVAEEVGLFNKQLAKLAKQGEVFRFEDLVTKLVFCIVTQSIIGVRFDALTAEEPDPVMLDIFSPAKDSPAAEASWNPWEKFVLSRKAAAALARSGKWMRQLILERYRARKKDPGHSAESLLDAILVDRVEQEEQGAAQSLEQDPEHLDMLVNQWVFSSSSYWI
jgi:cytochrome P450